MARIHTIGHSTRSLEKLIDLLREHHIALLVDVRRFPGSRRHPHFASDALAASLPAAGVEYIHEPDLGGYRKARPDSRNTAWRVAGFRAYADHMDSDEFREALGRLIGHAENRATAIMCAEAVPWRCHRRLISDALVARGHEVVHILALDKAEGHELNPNARVLTDGRLVYPDPSGDQMDLDMGSR
jgi:uncharacterized protein (DUF488 family)